ncbi:response regulator transcription factor [Streptomyces sp. 549]|uniref:response regulator transcription factor n=1 Tax=Streptomyces sp. 549 TaxID=3049076 RepID=UPI0024C30D38|nr:response regulator transcription factor [Streptomyces sp. 549]MDK1476614.1 response regulator transcription factor [Streptomyces sp. 549]
MPSEPSAEHTRTLTPHSAVRRPALASSTAADPHTVEQTATRAPLPAPRAAAEPGRPGALRVLVADDNPVVRAGLTALLTGREDITVVAEAADGDQAHEAARRHRPDVILLDVRMPGVDGLTALPHLARLAPVLMLTYSQEGEIVHRALRLGAEGYLVHGEFTAEELVRAVRTVRHGQAHFTATPSTVLLAQLRKGDLGAPGTPTVSPRGQFPQNSSHAQPVVAESLSGRAWGTAAPDGPPPAPAQEPAERFGLSSREAEIMSHIASGMANAQIAAACFVAEKTVKNHINRIFTKLHTTTRSEAIAVWLGTARGRTAGHG